MRAREPGFLAVYHAQLERDDHDRRHTRASDARHDADAQPISISATATYMGLRLKRYRPLVTRLLRRRPRRQGALAGHVEIAHAPQQQARSRRASGSSPIGWNVPPALSSAAANQAPERRWPPCRAGRGRPAARATAWLATGPQVCAPDADAGAFPLRARRRARSRRAPRRTSPAWPAARAAARRNGARGAERQIVGLDAESHRREERVGRAKMRAPARNGPPNRASPSAHKRLEPREVALQRGVDRMQADPTPQFMPQVLRSAWKPECISAAALRAQARAAASGRPDAGVALAHVFGDGQRVPHRDGPVDQAGHLAGGREARKASGFCAPPKGTRISRNGMSSSRISTQGRSDQEE